MKIQQATQGKWLMSHGKPYTFSDVVYLPDSGKEWQEVSNEEKERIEAEQQAEFEQQQEIEPTEGISLEQAKASKIAEVEAYDSSNAVNSFSLNGVELWLDKDTRVGLRNLLDIQKQAGQENTLIWYEGMKIELPIDTAYQLLAQVELYAFECYNATEQHKVEINALTSVEEVEQYDITKGYPSKLKL